MQTPGSGHTIGLERATQRWRAAFNDQVIADSDEALLLHEASMPPVIYFPRKDIAMAFMGRTARSTHCPFKFDASYFTLTMNGQIAENVAWSYETPFDQVADIAGRLAFYTDRVEVYAVDDAKVNPHHRELDRSRIDEIVQHTDTGGGTSQREHWAPNVETP